MFIARGIEPAIVLDKDYEDMLKRRPPPNVRE